MFTNEFADLLLNLYMRSVIRQKLVALDKCNTRAPLQKSCSENNVTVICDAWHGIALKLVTNHIYEVIKLSNSAKHFSASS